ncbi:MAG: 3-deoxy-manno-octulosonate cytidylyltransferase [Planctomycetota bacterium]|nr:3-deoxy-manno-octulosonate cytidylyltransferase [Planctomycetota bacterium]
MTASRSMIVIPARMHSTRLPRKMMLQETGKPLIQHTFEAASRATRPERIIVATDHREIAEVVKAFGGEAIMTDPNAASGTDRVAEVALQFPEIDIFANVQGDEPEISAAAIDRAIESLEEDESSVMSTLATPIQSQDRLLDPSCVKVVFDHQGNALYFSRSPIPCARNGWDEFLQDDSNHFFQHVGLYCYRREFLARIETLPDSDLEKIESLEQLRILQSGFRIKTAVIPESAAGIDTEEDYRAFVKRCLNC